MSFQAQMPLSHRRLRAVLLSTALVSIAVPAVALAQSPGSGSASSAKSVKFDVQAQDLDSALTRIADQGSIRIFFTSAEVAGIRSRPVAGEMSVEQALSQALTGTGFGWRYQESRTVVIEKLPESANGAVQLGPVRVEGASGGGSGYSMSLTSDPGATEGTGSYTATGPSKTATGLGLSLRETPQSVTVVTRKKIDDFGLDTLEKVLDQTPGAFVYKQGDQLIFNVRGAAVTNFQTNGSRQQEYRNDEFTYTSFSFDDMSNVDRIEVLKGSSGLLTGDGYPTATINRILKRPTREFFAQAVVGAGSWSNYNASMDISGPLTSNGGVRGRAVVSWKDGESFKDYVRNKNLTVYGTLDFDITENTLLNVGVDFKHREARGIGWYYGARAYDTYGNFDGLTSRSWNSAAPWSGYKQNVLNTFATLEHHISDEWVAKLQISREIISIPQNKIGVVGTPSDDLRYTWVFSRRVDDQKSETNNLNLNINGKFDVFGRSHEIFAGIELSRNDFRMDYLRETATYSALQTAAGAYRKTFNYIQDGGRYLPEPSDGDLAAQLLFRSTVTRRGAFAASRLNITDYFKAIVGTRVSDYIYHFKQTNVWNGANSLSQTDIVEKRVFTPYSGAVLDINRNFSLYGSYASVFQPVTVQDDQGRTLDPQKGSTYEVGLKAEFYDGRLNASIAHYWKRWENSYELSGGTTPTGDPAYRNVNGVMDHGYEFEISGEIVSGWQAQSSYSANFNGTEASVNYIPKRQFKLNTTYQFDSGRLSGLSVGGAARWQSTTRVYDSASYETKLKQYPYWVFDLTAGYRLNSKISANVNLNNIFDKKYFSGLNWRAGSGEYYNWGSPRSINGSIRYTF